MYNIKLLLLNLRMMDAEKEKEAGTQAQITRLVKSGTMCMRAHTLCTYDTR